jgi:hypothetical protein
MMSREACQSRHPRWLRKLMQRKAGLAPKSQKTNRRHGNRADRGIKLPSILAKAAGILQQKTTAGDRALIVLYVKG